jgi:hypothetical protein
MVNLRPPWMMLPPEADAAASCNVIDTHRERSDIYNLEELASLRGGIDTGGISGGGAYEIEGAEGVH